MHERQLPRPGPVHSGVVPRRHARLRDVRAGL